jgi:hypothetical protein
LENRIARLESLVSSLTSIATRTYIALLSIPREIRNQDPDFDKSMGEMSKKLDEMFELVINKKEAET